MKRTVLVISTTCLLALGAKAQHTTQKTTNNKNSTTMTTVNKSTAPVQKFFSAFGKGDFEGVINSFSDDCKITAVRDGKREDQQIYGAYNGKDGAKAFLTNLGNAFDTKAFSVEHLVGEGNIAFANGKFTHVVKVTGKTFTSDWSLMCEIKDGKISTYHFYEDSAKYVEASK